MATFLESPGARMAFPCFDEPQFRANFTLSVAAPTGYVALSNGLELDTIRLQAGGTKVRQHTPYVT